MNLIDTFALPQYGNTGGDSLFKARLLIGILIAILTLITPYGLFFGLSPSMSMDERLAGVVPMIVMWIVFLSILWTLKNKGMFNLCTHIVIGIATCAIFSGIYMTGGPAETPSGMQLLIPLFMAFSLLGFKEGIIWGCVIIALFTITSLMHGSGHVFPMVTKPEMMSITRIFNWYIAFLILIALFIINMYMSNRLRDERDAERDKYRHVAEVAAKSIVVNETADAMTKSGHELLNASLQQKTAIEQLSTTAEELGATAEQNKSLAASAMESIKETEKQLGISAGDIMHMVKTMHEVQKSSEEIKSINNVIDEIAYQTNMLSLNAMIEASRAGDGNGGFKVVAVEVKKLSERSAKAAENINKLLERNFLSVKQGVGLSQSMEARFREITENVKPVTQSIQNVSDASYEQNEAIRQIMLGLLDIDRAIENNQELSQSSSTMALKLKSNSEELLKALATLQNG
jgi:formylmethanofuran dehydrogenase subunit D